MQAPLCLLLELGNHLLTITAWKTSVGKRPSVTPGFKIKARCSSYVCPGSSCHTYGQNVNIENQCLYYINFITRNIVFTRLSRQVAAEHIHPTGNRLGATQASKRNLHQSSPSHLHLLSSVTARVSRLMVATQQVNWKTE
jgi:hypothetical protein